MQSQNTAEGGISDPWIHTPPVYPTTHSTDSNRTCRVPHTSLPAPSYRKNMRRLFCLLLSGTRINSKFVLPSFLNIFTVWIWISRDGVRQSHWSWPSVQSASRLPISLSKPNKSQGSSASELRLLPSPKSLGHFQGFLPSCFNSWTMS